MAVFTSFLLVIVVFWSIILGQTTEYCCIIINIQLQESKFSPIDYSPANTFLVHRPMHFMRNTAIFWKPWQLINTEVSLISRQELSENGRRMFQLFTKMVRGVVLFQALHQPNNFPWISVEPIRPPWIANSFRPRELEYADKVLLGKKSTEKQSSGLTVLQAPTTRSKHSRSKTTPTHLEDIPVSGQYQDHSLRRTRSEVNCIDMRWVNYQSSGRNRTYAFATPVKCSCHWATEVADKSKRG